MKRLIPIFFLSFIACGQTTVEDLGSEIVIDEPVIIQPLPTRDQIYIVSSRVLGDTYGHPLVRGLVQNKMGEYIYTMYLDHGQQITRTTGEQLMHKVATDVQRLDPSLLILDEIGAAGYLMDLLPLSYREKTYYITRTDLARSLGQENRIRTDNVSINIRKLVDTFNLFPETYYILYNPGTASARSSYKLKQELTALRVGKIESYEVVTDKDLENLLLRLNANQRGVIINNISGLEGAEFGNPLTPEQIKSIVTRRNLKHMEIGFIFIQGVQNESVILEPDYGTAIQAFAQKPIDLSGVTIDFRVVVSKGQMTKLGYKANYVSGHEIIDQVVE
jgi:hypothetical protein